MTPAGTVRSPGGRSLTVRASTWDTDLVPSDDHPRAESMSTALCPSAWAVIVLYSGLAAVSVVLAVAFALGPGSAALVGFLAAAGALSALGALGTYLRQTGRPGHRTTGDLDPPASRITIARPGRSS